MTQPNEIDGLIGPQTWEKTVVSYIYTIRQKNSGRYLDAYLSSNDYTAVTRPYQSSMKDHTQKWILSDVGSGRYTVQQVANGRYLDAYPFPSYNFDVVTRNKQSNNSQDWKISPVFNLTLNP